MEALITQVFHESDLHFQFSEDWEVRAYDRHKYYRLLKGDHMKGVDFIGILQNDTLVLMEIKNYLQRTQSPVPPILDDLLGESPPLLDAFIHKIEDTLLVVNVIIKYLRRKRWYRWALFFRRFWQPKKDFKRDWVFWTKIHHLIHKGKQPLHLVLWLQLEEHYPELDAAQLSALKQRLQQGVEQYFSAQNIVFHLASTSCNPYEDSLIVKR